MKKYYQTTLRLWKLLRPFHLHFYINLSLTVLIQGILIASTLYLSKTLNAIVDKDFILAAELLAIYSIIRLSNIVLDTISLKRSNRHIENSIQQFLEEYSFRKIFKLNPSQYIEDHSAIKLQVINRGESAIENIISTVVLTLIPTITQVIFSIAAIAYYSPWVALLVTIIFTTSVIWTNFFSNFHRPFIIQNTDNWDNQRKVRSEAFQHLSLIKVSGSDEGYLTRYLSKRSEYLDHSIKTNDFRINHGYKRWILFTFGRSASILIMIYQYSLSLISLGSIYAVWSWLNDVFSNIGNVIRAMREMPLRYVELEKYLDIIDKNPVFKESGVKKFEMGDIVFENVSFKYPKSEGDVIDNLNLKIEQGKKTAFVGFSGSGKSTIIKLLLRIYDWNEGDIKLDNLSLRKLDAQILRQKIGYVEQHVDLFDISIRENILFGIPSGKLSQEKLNEVVYKSRIEEFFHRLGTAGLDTVIGERGVKLSGGERQRIGIARALAKDPEILIFDEATASLDTENEKYIQEAIDESSKGRTTIIIAHRLSTVQNADKIVVMDKGKIVGEGTHEYLKETCSEYQRLIHAQN